MILGVFSTGLNWRRPTRATLFLTPIAWCTTLDAQCYKLAMVVGRLLTTLVTVDVPWRNFLKVQRFFKVPEASRFTFIFGDTRN